MQRGSSYAAVDACSPRWDEPADPLVSVHVPSYQRAVYITDLIDALESQDLRPDAYEVVIVDDGSKDGTWEVLTDRVARSPIRMKAVRADRNGGPAAARNRAVAVTTAPVLAFTDDDCIPDPDWLSGLLQQMEPEVAVLQGRVRPPAGEWGSAGPWDHTIWVSRPSPFFETCNVAYRRDVFEAAGGFDEFDPLLTPEEGRGFGEDAELANRVLQLGGRRAFAEDAVVYHRCVPRTFREHLIAQRHVRGFPGLARRSHIFGQWLKGRMFLSRRSAAFDGAIVAVLVAGLARRPVLLVGTLPWGWLAAKDASRRAKGDKRRALTVLPGVAVTDLVTFVSLIEGSIKYRRPML